jgi:hypothetical protein
MQYSRQFPAVLMPGQGFEVWPPNLINQISRMIDP